jgi:phage N-6-adenine-methyltransferase
VTQQNNEEARLTNALAKPTAGKLSKYNPERGLKTIAVAEAAVKHYARAKDAGKLSEAIRAKLTAQAEFVLWWDTQVEKQQGSRGVGKKVASQIGDATFRAGDNGLPDRQTISRWRKKLNDPDRFETAYEQAVAKYRKLLEFDTTAHVGHNSGENEWYTPAEYIEAARIVMGGIDLDPATSDAANRVVKAAQIFTESDDGLTEQWDGRVWMNPPYAQPLISTFCEKLAESVRVGTVTQACALVNNATETQWFRALVDVSAVICFPTGRVRFWSPSKESATPLQGQAVLYAGANVSVFTEHFSAFGWIADISR